MPLTLSNIHCKVKHFAGDRNLLKINKLLKKLNKLLNIDQKTLQIGLMLTKIP